MALVADGFRLVVSLADNGGNVSSLTYVLTAEDHATAVTNSATIVAALDAVTNSVIVQYAIKTVFAENGFVYPEAGVENENKASITVLLDGLGAKKANVKIPAPVIGIFTDTKGLGANVVDISDVDLNAYLDIFESGNEATLSDGETMDKPLTGKRISARSNRG